MLTKSILTNNAIAGFQVVPGVAATNITIKTMASLLKPLGYKLAATKGKKTVKLSA